MGLLWYVFGGLHVVASVVFGGVVRHVCGCFRVVLWVLCLGGWCWFVD